jgi:transcriptional regulator with XRE-family HTH domain
MTYPSGFPAKPPAHVYSAAWRADCIAYTQQRIAAGASLSAVARELRMNDSTIARWFTAAGLTPPPGAADGERKQRIITQAERLRAKGKTLRAIAGKLHVCEKRLSSWLRKKAEHEPQANETRERRACITCRNSFLSEGKHRWMCVTCRARADASSPFEPMSGGDTGRRVRVVR